MGMKVTAECLVCHFDRTMKKAMAQGDEEKALAFAKDLMRMYQTAPEDVSSPWYNPQGSELFRKHFGFGDEQYLAEKEMSNRFVMDRFDTICRIAETAADPVLAGLQLAILGNYMDFAALQGQVSFEKLDGMLDTAQGLDLDRVCYRQFCADLEKGTRFLYVTDNAGEIGFDRIMAETLVQAYPHLQITFLVRGAVISNDATREDAQAVGIDFPILDSGNAIGGTSIPRIRPEAKQAFDEADVILAKGMGNTESMFGCGYNVYYAFLVKCARFQQFFEKPLMTPMFIRDQK